jgi:hypothetical protein
MIFLLLALRFSDEFVDSENFTSTFGARAPFGSEDSEIATKISKPFPKDLIIVIVICIVMTFALIGFILFLISYYRNFKVKESESEYSV